MKKILVLDDDIVVLALTETIFQKDEYSISGFTKGEDALGELKRQTYHMIICDIVMPHMGGEEFFSKAREIQPHVPFIYITASDDLQTAVRVMKMGADDFIQKPINGEDLVERTEKVLNEKFKEQWINKTLEDDLIDRKDREGLFSWKRLYGNKDTHQSDRMMSFLSRNIDQAGGFMWLDMLRQKLDQKPEGDRVLALPSNMVELIIESTDYVSGILGDLNYVTSLQGQTFLLETLPLNEMILRFNHIFENELVSMAALHNRKISMDFHGKNLDYLLEIHSQSLNRVLKELMFNALKYSPPMSKIMIHLDIREKDKQPLLEISYWNEPVQCTPELSKGEPVYGIPYEYSESVFELFYTMERFPVRIKEEEWSQGTGLYIVRKLLQKMNGEICARNIVMHRPEHSLLFVKTTIYLPLQRSH